MDPSKPAKETVFHARYVVFTQLLQQYPNAPGFKKSKQSLTDCHQNFQIWIHIFECIDPRQHFTVRLSHRFNDMCFIIDPQKRVLNHRA